MEENSDFWCWSGVRSYYRWGLIRGPHGYLRGSDQGCVRPQAVPRAPPKILLSESGFMVTASGTVDVESCIRAGGSGICMTRGTLRRPHTTPIHPNTTLRLHDTILKLPETTLRHPDNTSTRSPTTLRSAGPTTRRLSVTECGVRAVESDFRVSDSGIMASASGTRKPGSNIRESDRGEMTSES